MRKIWPHPLLTAACLCAAALAALPQPAWADDAPFVSVAGGASFLSQWSSGIATPGTASYGLGFGYHFDDFEIGIAADHTYWLGEESRRGGFPETVLNVGVEGALLSFHDRVRHAIALGTSTMLFSTTLEESGHTGLYLEATPVGIRLPLARGWRVEFEPINVALMAPVLDGIPLFQLAYRSAIGIGVEL